jgi:hypothetical protein
MKRRITIEVHTIGDHFRFEIPEDAADVQITPCGEELGRWRSVTYRPFDSKEHVTCTVELL